MAFKPRLLAGQSSLGVLLFVNHFFVPIADWIMNLYFITIIYGILKKYQV